MLKKFIVTFKFDKAETSIREVSFTIDNVENAIQAIGVANDMLRYVVSGNYRAECLQPSGVSTFSI